MSHLKVGGRLYITTPNPTASSSILRALLGRKANTYWDHVSCFAPENIQAICDRHHYVLKELYFFDHVDRRSTLNLIKSIVLKTISSFNPRLSTSYMAILEKN